MVALEERKVAIIAILCSLFLLGSMSGIAFVSSREEENGTLYMDDSAGIFHLWIDPSSSNWELIVEQNIDSIPEFPSWTILPLFLAATAFALAVRKRGLHNISKPSNQL